MSSNNNINNNNQRFRNFNVIKERLRKNREATTYNSNYDRVNNSNLIYNLQPQPKTPTPIYQKTEANPPTHNNLPKAVTPLNVNPTTSKDPYRPLTPTSINNPSKRQSNQPTLTPLRNYRNNQLKSSATPDKCVNVNAYEGICPNCMNSAIIAGRDDCNDNHYIDIEQEPFNVQAKRNQTMLNAIKDKVQERYNQTQKIGYLISATEPNQKERMINAAQNSEFTLNKSNKDTRQEKTLKTYNKNMRFFKGKNYDGMNPQVAEFYKNETQTNKATEQSISSIGTNPYSNKYVINQNDYRKILNDQITYNNKRKILELEQSKQFDKEVNENNKRLLEEERKSKQQEDALRKKEFLKKNKELIDHKLKEVSMNEKEQLEREKRNNEALNERLLREKKEEIEKKRKQRLEMQKEMDNHVQLERNRKGNNNESGYCGMDGNVFREPHVVDEYGRCVNCNKAYNKRLLSNVGDYNKLKQRKKMNNNKRMGNNKYNNE